MTPAPQANADVDEGQEAAGGVSPARRRALICAVAVGAIIAAACAALASLRSMQSAPQYAQVLAVTPISRQIRTPRELCKSEEVRHVRPALDAREPSGKRNDVGAHDGATYTTTEEHCTTVFEIETEPLGYEVRYRLNGLEGRVHMNHIPGRRIRLRDGQLAPEESASAPTAAGPN